MYVLCGVSVCVCVCFCVFSQCNSNEHENVVTRSSAVVAAADVAVLLIR